MPGSAGQEPDQVRVKMGETVDIAKKYARLDYEQLTCASIQKVKECLLDYLGCAFAGCSFESSRIVHDFAINNYARGNCTIIGAKEKLNAAGASFFNGSAAHAPELDDLHKGGGLHVGVVVIPVAISVAEARHLSGQDFIVATVAGYDVAVKVGRSANADIQLKKGFHTTSTCGVFGASTTASLLMKLDPDQTTNALGIAGSFASGSLECYSDGSLTKRINPGIAASSGVMAAELAARGYTGPKSILEGPRGFLKAYSCEGFNIKELVRTGSFEIEGIGLKLHASCGFNQAPIDAILKIRSDKNIKHEDVKSILIELSGLGYFTVGQPEEIKLNPKNEVDAQFSAPYSVAVACIDGMALMEQYSPSAVSRRDIRSLMNKIKIRHSPSLDEYGADVLPARVTVKMQDGSEYSEEVSHAKGDRLNPLSWEELVYKFRSMVPVSLATEEQLDRIVDIISGLERIGDMNELSSLLS